MLHLLAGTVPVPYPSWLNTGDNTWQITAATFVGLMSLPGLAVLYAAIVPKKWAVNVLAMMFAGFSLVLIAWVLWTYKMGFGATSLGDGVVNGVQTQPSGVGWVKHFFDNFVGKPGQVTNSHNEQGQAVSAANTVIPVPLPDRLTRLLPVRVRGHHAAAVPRQRARPDQVQRLVHPRARCGRPSSTASTPSCSGAAATSPRRERSTSPADSSSTCRPGCPGFVAAWVPRAPAQARSRSFRTEQPAHGRRRRRHPVARMERLQRWGPVLRRSEHVRRRGQHQPGHRRRRHHLDGHGRLALRRRENRPSWAA